MKQRALRSHLDHENRAAVAAKSRTHDRKELSPESVYLHVSKQTGNDDAILLPSGSKQRILRLGT
jgi:hypothetical protein